MIEAEPQFNSLLIMVRQLFSAATDGQQAAPVTRTAQVGFRGFIFSTNKRY